MEKNEARKHAAEQLVRIADQMERVERGSKAMADLTREYKFHLKMIQAETPPVKRKNSEIKAFAQRKQECFNKIMAALDDFKPWEEKIKGLYIGEMGHIEFSYAEYHEGHPFEIQFMIPANGYQFYSGYKAIKNRVSLFSVKQLDGYYYLDYGLLKFAMAMVKGKPRKEFIAKYVDPYNEAVKLRKQQADMDDQEHQ